MGCGVSSEKLSASREADTDGLDGTRTGKPLPWDSRSKDVSNSEHSSRRATSRAPSGADIASFQTPEDVIVGGFVDSDAAGAVMERLGEGAFCAVFACAFKGLPAVLKVPLKTCNDRGAADRDLRREMKVLSKTSTHPGIVKVFGVGTHDKPFVLLERLEQGNLATMLGTNKFEMENFRTMMNRKKVEKLHSIVARLSYGKQLAEALAHLHEHAIPGGVCLHR